MTRSRLPPIAATVAAIAASAWAIADQRFATFNAEIYRQIGQYFHRTGELPERQQLLGRVEGKYADFTPLNLRVYEVVFGLLGSDTVVFVIYQMVLMVVGLWVLWAGRGRLGLGQQEASWILAAAVVCFIPCVLGHEDKTSFFTMTVVAMVLCRSHSVAAGAALGLLIGWTGVALLAAPMVVFRRSARDAAAAAGAMALAGAGAMAVAGRHVTTLVENRAQREDLPRAVWYSIWQLVEPRFTPSWAMAAAIGLAGLAIALWWFGAISAPGGIAFIAYTTLSVSNSTVPTRVAMLLPLCAVVFVEPGARLLWSGLVIAWAVPVGASMLGWLGWYQDFEPFGLSGDLQVLAVNAPLLVLIGYALWVSSSVDLRASTSRHVASLS